MRQAMSQAEVGDEQQGTDPTVNRLLERVANLLGKEEALFLPSGTMCNLIAIKVHTLPGDVVFADQMAHIIRAECGGAGLASGVLIERMATERGIFTPQQLEQAIRRAQALPFPYSPVPRLVCVEQTHNLGGGSVWRLDELRAIGNETRRWGLATHMDGARLLNAAVASGTPARDFAACVDSSWIDFTKGLGAPLGAVLAGSSEFVAEARRYKHLFGGALRQAGIVAGGCLHALDHHVDRLQEDHQNARRLAERLAQIEGIYVRTPIPETNMVFFEVSGLGLDADQFLALLAEQGISMGGVGEGIRAVTHLDVSRTDVDRTIDTIAAIAQSQPRATPES
jgi:threonine aldolase